MNDRNKDNIQSAADFLIELANHYRWLETSKQSGLCFGDQPMTIYQAAFNFILDLAGITDHPEIDMRHGLRRIFEENPPTTKADGIKLLKLMYKVSSLEEREINNSLDTDRTGEVYFNPECFFSNNSD